MSEMPELPPPDRTEVLRYSERFDGTFDSAKWFTADQMTAYARQAVAAAMERAAQIAEGKISGNEADPDTYSANEDLREVAAAIRAEMSKETL